MSYQSPTNYVAFKFDGIDERIDYNNPSSSATVAAGQVVVTNGIVGFAVADIPPSSLGALSVTGGCWRGDKASGGWTLWNPVYWNPTATPNVGTAGSGAFTQTNAAGCKFVGYCIASPGTTAAALSGDQFGYFKRLGNTPYTVTDNTGGTPVQTVLNTACVTTMTLPIPTLAGLANSQALALDPGFNGQVLAAFVRSGPVPPSTSAKAATLTVTANGSAVTGGVGTLTTANLATAGEQLPFTAITASNSFTAGQTVGVNVSSVTAFSEGQAVVEFQLLNLDLANALATLLGN